MKSIASSKLWLSQLLFLSFIASQEQDESTALCYDYPFWRDANLQGCLWYEDNLDDVIQIAVEGDNSRCR